MKKYLILTLVSLIFLVFLFSGCTSTESAMAGGLLCFIIPIIGIIIFILIVAWLIGGGSKKTEVHYIPQQPIQQQTQQHMSTQFKYCPNCRTQMPIHSKFCNECGFRF